MNAHVLLNLLNLLRKSDKMRTRVLRGMLEKIAYFYLETSNLKLAQNRSFHAIKELHVARNPKLQPMYPLPKGVTVR